MSKHARCRARASALPEVSAQERYLETLGYGQWLLSQGEISQEEYEQGREAARQAYSDAVAGEMLEGVNLSSLGEG